MAKKKASKAGTVVVDRPRAKLQPKVVTPYSLFIQSLGDARVTSKKPFPVCVTPSGEEFIVSWLEANIGTGGATVEQAVSRLQSLICEVFLDIVDQTDETLGRSARKQKQVLTETLCRT